MKLRKGKEMIKNDIWIRRMAEKQGMIEPFESVLIRNTEPQLNDYQKGFRANRVISYGASSFGYDIRLSSEDFKIFRHIPGTVVDPKSFNSLNLIAAELHKDIKGNQFFILPAHSYALGVAHEKINMPKNVTALAIGKSTYARCGIIANLTPIEAGWNGYLTIELSNSSSADCRIYALEGIAQLLFFEGENCLVSYEDRQGKYQSQSKQVTLPRV